MAVKSSSGSSSVSSAIILLIVLFICCGRAAAESNAESPKQDLSFSDIQINVNDYFGEEKYWVDMVHSIVSSYIRRGDRFSETDINLMATALKECHRFRLIQLDTKMTEDGLILKIDVTPFRLIKNIKIRGKYPLFEKEIFNVMTVYPGDPFIEEEIEKQPELVAGLYRRNGYIDPKVTIESLDKDDNGHYFIQFSIDKGRPYRLGELDIQGNRAFTESRIRWKMKSILNNTTKFSEKKFLEDIEKLRKFYRANGFCDFSVDYRLTKNPDKGTTDVQIVMEEGDQYRVEFVGNEAFWNLTLKKDLVLFSEGNARGAGLRKSIRNMEERYHAAGYAKAAVTVETQRSQEENISVRNLQFVISEGPRTTVGNIVISGNSFFSREELEEKVLTRTPGWFHDGQYVPQILEEDVLAIQNLYQASGFLDVTVEQTVQAPADQQPVVIHLKITEGPQTMVSRVTLEGLKVIPEEGVLKKIRIQEGRPFSYGGLRNDEKQIAMMVSEKGYPYVQVSGDAEISEDRSEAWVLYRVTQNSYIKRGKTFYSGNFRTKKRILDRELIMRDGDPFSLRKMLRGQQNIRSMNIFRSVAFRPVGLKEKAETIHIFTELEEEKPFYFEASGGYETEKGLFGTSTVGDHNFFGLNKDFKINGEISEVGSRVESRIFDPRLFSTRVSADAGVFSERSKPFNQTFGTDTRGFDLVFSREWKKRIKSWLGFYYEVRENFVRDSQVEEDETFDPRGILMVKPSISYDSRDNFMNPKEGIFMLFGIDISRGVVNSLDDFYKYRCDLRGYTTPINRLTLAARGSFGKIDPYGSEGNIPPDQLFFLGGANNVRGFDENLFLTDENGDPVGGRLMAVGNIETRIDLGSNFEASFFWDVGYLDETFMSYQSENVRYSTGVGLRYVTPVGAVGVVYGHKLNPEPDESPGRLHFSIGYTF